MGGGGGGNDEVVVKLTMGTLDICAHGKSPLCQSPWRGLTGIDAMDIHCACA